MKTFILLTFIACLTPLAVSGAGLEHDMKVTIGLFDAARVRMSYDLDAKKYSFTSAIATDGIFNSLYPFEAEYHTRGLFDKGRLITQDYHYTSRSSAHTRTKQLVFDRKGILSHRLSSKDGDKKQVQIELPPTPFDSNDIQTVFAALTRQFQNSKFCALEKTIFDGKKSYLVSVADEGKSKLSDPEIPFKGQAWKCSLRITSLENEQGDILWQSTAERPVYFWIMQDKESNLPFIAKIEIDSTPLGRIKAYTEKLEIK